MKMNKSTVYTCLKVCRKSELLFESNLNLMICWCHSYKSDLIFAKANCGICFILAPFRHSFFVIHISWTVIIFPMFPSFVPVRYHFHTLHCLRISYTFEGRTEEHLFNWYWSFFSVTSHENKLNVRLTSSNERLF